MLAGTIKPGTFRVLLDRAGTGRRAVYAVETEYGRVCFGLTRGPSGCIEGFPAHLPATYTIGDPDVAGSGEPVHLFGLLEDSVTAVEVEVAGDLYPALVGKNSYFFEVPSSALEPQDVDALILRLSDGTRQRVPLWS
jgi:hypothetical protein